jgi:putative phosphoesterase
MAQICVSLMPAKLSFLCGDVTVGLIHGDGAPDMVLDKVQAAFRGTKVNVVIFGHSHKTCNVVIDGVLFFNPGSPTDTIRAPFRSYGILEISGLRLKERL